MLVVTKDSGLASQVEALLDKIGVSCRDTPDLDGAASILKSKSPQIALVDGSLGGQETIEICAYLRKTVEADRLAIMIVVDNMDDNTVNALLNAGADGLVARSLKPLSFRARVAAHLNRIAAASKHALKVHDSEVLIEVTSRLVGSADLLDNLYDVTMLIAKELNVDRCSVVLVRPQRDLGLVVASSDNPELRSLAIRLDRYPEIASAIDHGVPLIVEDVASSQVLKDVLPSLKDAGVTSVALFPIVRQKEALGVIFLRFSERHDAFEEREIVFCQTVANAASIALRNAEMLELLKAKTREVEKVQTEAQDKLRDLKRYEDFFISALDGNVVLEQSGKVVFANPVALEMMGNNTGDFKGRPFADFLIQEERQEFENLLDEFVHGQTRRSVDFHLQYDQDMERIISISAGSLFGEEGLVLLTIRDITEERVMENRLARARQQLVYGEKRAAMAELAGAAAHELNQPLTSVMTSLAMLRRLLDSDEKRDRVLTTLEQESERMASIIRRLTKITNYTTKDYVGDAKIIDLEGASRDEFGEKGS